MSDSDHICCSNCGRLLPAANAICPICDQELSPNKDTGRYRCPSCYNRFDQPALALWPPHAKWYQPQEQKAQCPYCKLFLRDKKVLRLTWIDWVTGGALVVAANIWHLKIAIAGILLLGIVSVQLVRQRRAWKSVRCEEERYAVEKTEP
jgi:uncharacterized paraquat-inducible protein A